MAKMLTIIKCHEDGEEIFRWEGVELERSPTRVLLEARFNIEEHFVGGMQLKAGDRLVEHYYTDRLYNIFEVYAGEDGAFKGWYCNLSKPAQLGEREIVFEDLALDLIVYPDGRQEELDVDEFEDLEISDELRAQALEAWDELREHFRRQFDE